MKSKLVKYPFNDGKRYRWDTYKMGKRFEYSWSQSKPNNFQTITPYIKAEPFIYDSNTTYGLINTEDPDWSDVFITPAGTSNAIGNLILDYGTEATYNEKEYTSVLYDTLNREPENNACYVEQNPANHLYPYRIAKFYNSSTDTYREVQYNINDTIPEPLNDETLDGYYAIGKGTVYAYPQA